MERHARWEEQLEQTVKDEKKGLRKGLVAIRKGAATYHAVTHPETGETVADRIWSYERPTPAFAAIKDYVSFYVQPWDCFVDGEKVEPQPGDFYGGWLTADIAGPVKGGPGTLGW